MHMKKLQKSNVRESIDTGAVPAFFDPGKKRKIEAGVPEVEGIMPERLSPEAQKYLELITSQSYKMVVDHLCRYTGITPEQLNQKPLPNVLMAFQFRCVDAWTCTCF